jgi:hypothetical protein
MCVFICDHVLWYTIIYNVFRVRVQPVPVCALAVEDLLCDHSSPIALYLWTCNIITPTHLVPTLPSGTTMQHQNKYGQSNKFRKDKIMIHQENQRYRYTSKCIQSTWNKVKKSYPKYLESRLSVCAILYLICSKEIQSRVKDPFADSCKQWWRW